MANDPVPVRRYNDREVALILKRAAERENEVPQARDAGYSLADLEEIAAQAGIERSAVRAAALELDRSVAGAEAPGGSLIGSPSVFEMERELAGEIPESAYGELIETIRRITHEVGTPTRVERALEWAYREGDLAGVHISITPVRGRTRIRVISQHSAGAFLLFLTTMALGAIGSAVLMFGGLGLQGLPAAGGMLAGVGAVYLGDRALLRHIAHGRRDKAVALLEALVERVSGLVSPGPEALGKGGNQG